MGGCQVEYFGPEDVIFILRHLLVTRNVVNCVRAQSEAVVGLRFEFALIFDYNWVSQESANWIQEVNCAPDEADEEEKFFPHETFHFFQSKIFGQNTWPTRWTRENTSQMMNDTRECSNFSQQEHFNFVRFSPHRPLVRLNCHPVEPEPEAEGAIDLVEQIVKRHSRQRIGQRSRVLRTRDDKLDAEVTPFERLTEKGLSVSVLAVIEAKFS